jgi:Flp pilus assembly protein TadB
VNNARLGIAIALAAAAVSLVDRHGGQAFSAGENSHKRTLILNGGFRQMGANKQQGWALLLFLVGFTFFVAGLYALGPVSWIIALALIIASLIWCYRIKPLEHQGTTPATVEPVSMPQKKRQAG